MAVTVSQAQIRFRLRRPDFELVIDQMLPANGTTILFGPSGAGKTSLLRCLAGLDKPQSAFIQLGGCVWQDDSKGLFVPTWLRSLGFVFQEPSLFDHMNVRQNIEFGLKRTEERSNRQLVDQAIEMMAIGGLLERRCHQLSGGEKQRVAIARALATGPQVLLMDEPLASLDQARRHEILPWLERIRQHCARPMIYVTHSVEEMIKLGDHVIVLDRGQVVRTGAPSQLFASTDQSFAIGEQMSSVISATIVEPLPEWHLVRVRFSGGDLLVAAQDLPHNHKVYLRVFAKDVALSLERLSVLSIQNQLEAVIVSIQIEPDSPQGLVQIKCGDDLLLAQLTARAIHELNLHPGLAVWALIKTAAINL